jgi:hypothetical protein
MDAELARMWTDLVGRLTGPLTLRLYLQPTMATLFALRDGLKDARTGRPPYLWTVFTDPGERRHLIAEGWKAIGKISCWRRFWTSSISSSCFAGSIRSKR